MNHSVSTGGSLLTSPAWGSNGIAEFVGEVRFFWVSMAPHGFRWKATITCAAAAVSGPGRSHGLASGFARLRLGGRTMGPLEWWRCGATLFGDQNLLCFIKKNEVSCPAKKRVLPRSHDGWMFYYFLWYVSCWFLMESSIHQAVEITYLVPHCSGSLLLAKQEQ